jgi:hypothetical protein
MCLLSETVALAALASATILGWIAMTRIRRSAGRLYGMGLAVFGGLSGPAFLVDMLLWQIASPFFRGSVLAGGPFPGGAKPVFLWVLLPAIAIIDTVIARWVWREMSNSREGAVQAAAKPRPTHVIALGCAFASLMLAFIGLDMLRHPGSVTSNPKELANWPSELATRPTTQVIQAGLANPDSPWPWQELERRARACRLSPSEAQTVMDGLTGWMKREHPHGYNQPLNWMSGIMGELAKPDMVRDAQILALMNAFYGDPYLDELPRLREGASHLHLTCHWKSAWQEKPFGWALLNEMGSIKIDGEPVEGGKGYPKDWTFPQYDVDLRLPELSPGKHVVKCEVESALIAESDLTGVAKDATSADWPAAKRRWTRIAQAELSVYSKDAQIVGLTNDPALYPLAPDAPSAARVVLQRKGEGASATVVLKTSDKPPISFDLTLRVNGQTYGCGSIRNVPIKGGRTYGPNGTSAEVDMVDPKTKTAEVVLTPNPHAVEQCPGVDWIWGEEVVLTNVPLTRYDLPGTNSVPAQ